MTNPKAVLISDIHFNLVNLDLASKALRAAFTKAEELNVPLIIAGDLHDTKANMRAEVVNELLDIFEGRYIKTYLLVGNHDHLNEKGNDNALEFLSRHAELVAETVYVRDMLLIPYQNDEAKLKKIVKDWPCGTLIMHQGVKGAFMGDYLVDKTSVSPELFTNHRVFSGHYHKHQTIGTVTYIGSPYTITFGEANDGPKGFLVLNEDNTFTREILDLRKHIIIEADYGSLKDAKPVSYARSQDLIWLKAQGLYSELETLNKDKLGMQLFGHTNYKLDKIYIDTEHLDTATEYGSDRELFDKLIDKLKEPEEYKTYLKSMWKEIL